jgi:hypothetical protein
MSRYVGLDPHLAERAERYARAQEEFAKHGGAAFDLSDPATRARFVMMRAELDPWARTIARLNATVPNGTAPRC